MIDLDRLHAILQHPVAIIQLTVAVFLLMRWFLVLTKTVDVDSTTTGLLAGFLFLIAGKQLFWSVWGALNARDLFAAADAVRTHWMPVVFNASISIVGILLLARLGSIAFGRLSYGVTALAAVGVFLAGVFIVGLG